MSDERNEVSSADVQGVVGLRGESASLSFGVPVVPFPERMVDRRGVRVRPGCMVRLPEGQIGEVTAWSVGSRIQIALDVDEDSDEDLFADCEASSIEVIATAQNDALSLGIIPVEASAGPGDRERRVTIVYPIDEGDIVVRSEGGSRRALPEMVPDMKRFAAASIRALAEWSPAERTTIAATEVDAPAMRRALEETLLPRTVHRLVMVAESGEDREKIPYLLEYWVRGTGPESPREATRFVAAPPLDIHSSGLMSASSIAAAYGGDTQSNTPRVDRGRSLRRRVRNVKEIDIALADPPADGSERIRMDLISAGEVGESIRRAVEDSDELVVIASPHASPDLVYASLLIAAETHVLTRLVQIFDDLPPVEVAYDFRCA